MAGKIARFLMSVTMIAAMTVSVGCTATQLKMRAEEPGIDLEGSTTVTAHVLNRWGWSVRRSVEVEFASENERRAEVGAHKVNTDFGGRAVVRIDGAGFDSGEVEITGSIDDWDDNVKESDSETVVIMVGPGHATRVTLEAARQTIALDGTAIVTAEVVDGRENPVTDVEVTFVADRSDRARVSRRTVRTDSEGRAVVRVEGVRGETGDVTVTGSIDESGYYVAEAAEDTVIINVSETGPEDAPELPEEDPESPEDLDEEDPDSEVTDEDETEPLPGRHTDSEKQEIIQDSLINLVRVSVSSEEHLHLSDEKTASQAARNSLTSELAGLTFQVIGGLEDLPFDATEKQMDDFRESSRCNLAFLVKGDARKVDKFGNFYSYESELEGKVLNLTTHQVIASKTVSNRGERKLNERQAAEDALRESSDELTSYLTDEVARLWEVTSLRKVELNISNLGSIDDADEIRSELQGRPGVYYVSLESWSADDGTAALEVLCRFDTHRFLIDYAEESLTERGLTVKSLERGEIIKAR